MNDIQQCFPLANPRPQQVEALKFFKEAVEAGYRDIVIEAPTGSGKSAIGLAAAFWMSQVEMRFPECEPGAYYLVTQKLLQDQITDDIPNFSIDCQDVKALKASASYPCASAINCAVGKRRSSHAAEMAKNGLRSKAQGCHLLQAGNCGYENAKADFCAARVSLTNYAFFLTAKKYAAQIIPKKSLLICDEAHSVEDQIISFVDCTVSTIDLRKWTSERQLPKLNSLLEYGNWLEKEYVPELADRYHMLLEQAMAADDDSTDVEDLDKYICKINRSIAFFRQNPASWVFYYEENLEKTNSQYVAKPIYGAPYVTETLSSGAMVRLYMSAFPGVKSVFCRSLGLDPTKVAWKSFASEFPVNNRLVHFYPVGSMGSRSKLETMPAMLRFVGKLAKLHATRGIIHCVSYDVGNAVAGALIAMGHGHRIVFPKTADDREQAFEDHGRKEGAILISPSMTEGYDFAGDKARWQAIVKCAWPFLGNKQVAARLAQDEEWYRMKTLMSILQACGRICRSNTDHGVTYILDSDFDRLLKQAGYMLPAWFKSAIVKH